jgi:hypothetical protein
MVDRPDIASGDAPYTVRPEPIPATVTMQASDLEVLIPIAEMWASFPMAQPLPSEQVLIVGARSLWTASKPEHNATVYGPGGDVKLSACVGDGIRHALTTGEGAVWLGFSDEGVYGNMGWGRPGPAPLGASGIVGLNAKLEVEWEFPSSASDPVDDCYAMNWDGQRLWAYYYSDFPIVAIDGGRIRSWPTTVMGAKALVTDGSLAALVGGYRGDYDRVVVGRLETSLAEAEVRRLTMPDGGPLPRDAAIVANGSELHVFAGSTWLRLDIERIAS